MNSRGFEFRKFYVGHDRCAMKVGTDGILLGAWADVGRAQRILDVGTGSGLVGLILAQRQPTALITAVEIDATAVDQARENVDRSPWSNRIDVVRASFGEWVDRSVNQNRKFDLVICNPPFFSNSSKSYDQLRRQARHDVHLSIADLLAGAAELLNSNGRASLIVPSGIESECTRIAARHELYRCRQTGVRPDSRQLANRTMLEYSRQSDMMVEPDELVVYSAPQVYSHQYWGLTREFYLENTAARPAD